MKKKLFIIFAVIFGLILGILILGLWPFKFEQPKEEDIIWGVTFSKFRAKKKLFLDWKEIYLAILDDLKVKNLRLAAYWTYIEPEKDKYDFEDLDWQIKEAEKRGARIILAVGRKLPGWPECHEPEWAKNYESRIMNQELLDYIENTINQYKSNSAIWAWQVENEPFLNFGECPPLDKDLLDQEIALVRSLNDKPIIITDSGELSFWVGAARRSDIFGTTIYRVVYNKIIGYIEYPLPPIYFRFKSNIIRRLFGQDNTIVIELQAEPWTPISELALVPLEEQSKSMNLEQFRKNLDYARKTGFKEFYLWGAEWWFWMKEAQNNPEIWNEAELLFNSSE